MKGFLTAFKKLANEAAAATAPSPNAKPAEASSGSGTTSVEVSVVDGTDAKTKSSQLQPSSANPQPPATAPVTTAATGPSEAVSSPVAEESETIKKTRRSARTAAESVTVLSSQLFDHSKFIHNEIAYLSQEMDPWHSRDMELEIARADLTLKTLLNDITNTAATSDATLVACNQLLANNMEFCRALKTRGTERMVEHRRQALQSDERLKALRARLNTELKTEWEAGAKLHQMDVNNVLAKYGARPNNVNTVISDDALSSSAHTRTDMNANNHSAGETMTEIEESAPLTNDGNADTIADTDNDKENTTIAAPQQA